ncbi:unnamed protein product [Leptosia nina]|uniref:Uncharacterized protein n=1 Tax=Leptosia nina TaxID=320188 RepID=A0AAV1JLL7_9NEOP
MLLRNIVIWFANTIDRHGQQSPQHDFDLPLSAENAEEGRDGEWRGAGETDEHFVERALTQRAPGRSEHHLTGPRLK